MSERDKDIRIIKTDEFTSLDEAVTWLLEHLSKGRAGRCYSQFHNLGPFTGYPVHRHSKSNEWVVTYDNKFVLVTHQDGHEVIHEMQCIDEAIFIPSGACHTVRSLGYGLKYAVIKDSPDDFIPCAGACKDNRIND